MPSQQPPIAKPPRIDRARLAAAAYPSSLVLPVRFDDIDVLGHVNNVSILAYLQEARIAFNRSMREASGTGQQRAFVAATLIDYAAEMAYPGRVEVRSGLTDIGRSSYTFAQIVLQDAKPCVYSLVTMVNADEHGSAAIGEAFRATLEEQGRIREAIA